jgi:hypothetical protein
MSVSGGAKMSGVRGRERRQRVDLKIGERAMRARIYKPCRSTMQAGLSATRLWVLELAPAAPREPDPLMGWISAQDTTRQICLRFEAVERALDYAAQQGLDVDVEAPQSPSHSPKTYESNFALDRPVPWSH